MQGFSFFENVFLSFFFIVVQAQLPAFLPHPSLSSYKVKVKFHFHVHLIIMFLYVLRPLICAISPSPLIFHLYLRSVDRRAK